MEIDIAELRLLYEGSDMPAAGAVRELDARDVLNLLAPVLVRDC